MTSTLFGIDVLEQDQQLQSALIGRKIALLAHPASVNRALQHSLDVLMALPDISICCAFGPQHGLKGEKQDNMEETQNYVDAQYGIPIFSLYGTQRQATAEMMDSFDVLLIDLQDLGCRIYTFITTLRYMLEACAKHQKTVWILDRPNPIGRPVEGFILQAEWESFVGAGALPMRHGLTMGELTKWFVHTLNLSLDYQIIPMQGWQPQQALGYGWPLERSWVNPSPNAPNLFMARCYPGTVMLEGTTLSEGRGTTRPLECVGAPDLDMQHIKKQMQFFADKYTLDWLTGCYLRPCFFEPTFHKHEKQLCNALQIHVDTPAIYQHQQFRPWRLMALLFKAIKTLEPDYPLWRHFPYEYEFERLAIDLINGGPLLRLWVDNPDSTPQDLEDLTAPDETFWLKQRKPFLLYEE